MDKPKKLNCIFGFVDFPGECEICGKQLDFPPPVIMVYDRRLFPPLGPGTVVACECKDCFLEIVGVRRKIAQEEYNREIDIAKEATDERGTGAL